MNTDGVVILVFAMVVMIVVVEVVKVVCNNGISGDDGSGSEADCGDISSHDDCRPILI